MRLLDIHGTRRVTWVSALTVDVSAPTQSQRDDTQTAKARPTQTRMAIARGVSEKIIGVFESRSS
jgi:hypothetical protein